MTHISELVISRVFDIPVDSLFLACTDADHLVDWWGGGSPINVEQFELKPEGKFLYSNASGSTHWSYGMFLYKEIECPTKITFLSGFADKDGNFIRAPFCETFPLQLQNVWTFKSIEGGKTEITVHRTLFNDSPEEAEFFSVMLGGMQQEFFKGVFDQLEAHAIKSGL